MILHFCVILKTNAGPASLVFVIAPSRGQIIALRRIQ